MEVILAKSAGFCFGVRRAVNEVYRCLEEEKDTPIYTFGPIIHNDEVVNDLKNKGVQVVDTLESLAALKKGIVIIRSHGVSRDTETKMRELGMRVIDMTCPFVKKIHRLVEEKSKEGYQIVIAGNPVHPEVVGIVGWSTDGASVVKDAEEAQKQEKEQQNLLATYKGRESVTKSGKKIHLYANIGSVSDVAYVLENDAEGIGLFRIRKKRVQYKLR